MPATTSGAEQIRGAPPQREIGPVRQMRGRAAEMTGRGIDRAGTAEADRERTARARPQLAHHIADREQWAVGTLGRA